VHAGAPKFFSLICENLLICISGANLQNPLCFSRKVYVGFVQSYQAYRCGKLDVEPVLECDGDASERKHCTNATYHHDTEKRATVWRKRDNECRTPNSVSHTRTI
jgi:hypothetical protein